MSEDNSTKRALIFDFDGLILDTETTEVTVWKELYAQVGLTFDMNAYIKIVGTDGTGYDPAQILASREGEHRSQKQIREELLRRELDHCEKLDAMDGVGELISRAKRDGYLLGLGTSSVYSWINPHLTRLGLLDEFDVIITSEDVDQAKPAPDIFLKVLETLGVSADNAIVLEDSQNGVLAAHRAGIRAIAVPNSITASQDFSLATAVIPSLANFNPDQYL